ncbi:MAG: amidase domain-containing protein [Oscillospiraceae bacterium]|nr:amidase domain-containing protein [Oscillospiraceae bacterium]
MSYNAGEAIAYAHEWAHSRNPRYYNFTGIGGDCTNFISQCLFAGSGTMNYAGGGWYYRAPSDRAPSWTSVELLYGFLTRSGNGPGPRGAAVRLGDAAPGDVIQLSFDGEKFSHSLLVVDRADGGVLIAAHSDDSDYRPLETYGFAGLRCLRIC